MLVPCWVPGARSLLDGVPCGGAGSPRTGLPSNAARIVGRVATELRALGATASSFLPPASPAEPVPVSSYPDLRPTVTLFPWQQRGVAWALSREAAFFQWGTGAGKTLAGWLWGRGAGRSGRSIYVTASHLVPDALSKIRGYAAVPPRPYVCTGTKAAAIPADADLVLVAWNLLPAWSAALVAWAQKHAPALVMDEIHYVREYSRYTRYVNDAGVVSFKPKNNWSYHAELVSRACPRRLGMSATPAPKGRYDMWSPLDLVEPGCWGKFWDFAKRYCDAGPTEYAPLAPRGLSECDEFRARTATLLHVVTKAEVLAHLPPLRREVVHLSADQQGRVVGAAAWAKAMARSGTNKLEMGLALAAGKKRPWLVDTLTADHEAGLITACLTGRKEDARQLYDVLVKAGVTCLYGDGDTSPTSRVRIARQYLEAATPVCLVGTREAWGTGYDLQNADRVYIAQLPWTWELAAQTEGRFARPGQGRPVTIVYPVALGTQDEAVNEHLLSSLSDVQSSVDDSEVAALRGAIEVTQSKEDALAALIAGFTTGVDDDD